MIGSPAVPTGGERTTAVEIMPVERAAAFLARKGKPWEAELYRLAVGLSARSNRAGARRRS